MLEHQSINASVWLAKAAHQSAEKMEKMTEKMHTIAVQTQKETVSMKVITVVTLFFLPGTFISVGASLLASHFYRQTDLTAKTLMSTDIIRFQSGASDKPQRVYSSQALELFLEISLPLMALTFLVWAVWKRYQSRREDLLLQGKGKEEDIV